jgi:hypothetical protein
MGYIEIADFLKGLPEIFQQSRINLFRKLVVVKSEDRNVALAQVLYCEEDLVLNSLVHAHVIENADLALNTPLIQVYGLPLRRPAHDAALSNHQGVIAQFHRRFDATTGLATLSDCRQKPSLEGFRLLKIAGCFSLVEYRLPDDFPDADGA